MIIQYKKGFNFNLVQKNPLNRDDNDYNIQAENFIYNSSVNLCYFENNCLIDPLT